jgi:hypothetical protein
MNAALAINDLSLSNDLDRNAMSALTGGGSVTSYQGTSYSGFSTSYLGSSQRLTGFGFYNGKWAKFYHVHRKYRQTRTKTKHYNKIVWN